MHDITKWIYASVVPSLALFKINPVTQALTGCAGTVESIKANMFWGISYQNAEDSIHLPTAPGMTALRKSR